MTVHGEGRGGGEKVACSIVRSYELKGTEISIVQASLAKRELGQLKRNSISGSWQRGGANIQLLLTSGPRDISLMVYAILNRIPFAVYVQVPYSNAITFRDPIHALAVKFYIWLCRRFAQAILANSQPTAEAISPRASVVLPIMAAPSGKVPRVVEGVDYSELPSSNVYLVTACRYFPERGRGSRDLKALKKLLVECRENNDRCGRKVFVRHYGDVHAEIRKQLKEYDDVLSYMGFDPRWREVEAGPFFFFSVYEGFGLAALEAAETGKSVVVNGAFPSDLTLVAPLIRRVDTSTASISILDQVLNE